jgi:hypothetical protein
MVIVSASNRRVDSERYRCWLVGPLRDELQLHIAVFNPIFYATPAAAFRYLFDALVQLLPAGMSEESSRIKSVGMPILRSGLGGFKVQDAASPLIRGMIHWLALGLPLDRIDFVVLDGTDAATAADVLRHEGLAYLERPIDTQPPIRYDVFLSYARADAPEAS